MSTNHAYPSTCLVPSLYLCPTNCQLLATPLGGKGGGGREGKRGRREGEGGRKGRREGGGERREEGGKRRGEGEGRRREWGGRRMISNLRLRDMEVGVVISVDGPTSGGWEEEKEEGEGEEEKGSRQGLQDKKDVCKRCFFSWGPLPPLYLQSR